MFGEGHVSMRQVEIFVRKYQRSLEDFLQTLHLLSTGYKGMMPKLIIRYLQLYLDNWLETQWATKDVHSNPNSSSNFSDIKLGWSWEIPLPRYYEAVLKPFLNPTLPSLVYGRLFLITCSTLTNTTGTPSGGSVGGPPGGDKRVKPV